MIWYWNGKQPNLKYVYFCCMFMKLHLFIPRKVHETMETDILSFRKAFTRKTVKE
jgi:hypothetical protein